MKIKSHSEDLFIRFVNFSYPSKTPRIYEHLIKFTSTWSLSELITLNLLYIIFITERKKCFRSNVGALECLEHSAKMNRALKYPACFGNVLEKSNNTRSSVEALKLFLG